MSTQMTQKPKMTKIGDNLPIKWAVLGGFMVAAIVTIIALLIFFPNLASNSGYLAILIATSLLSFGSLGLKFSGLRARMPAAARWGYSIALWAVVALDVIFLILPNFISGPAVNEADPFAPSSANKPAVVATVAPTVARTTEAAIVKTSETISGSISGNFAGSEGHSVTGKALLGKANGKTVLRLENFSSTSGPDLVVYLSKEARPTTPTQVQNGLLVGALKATQGNLNYDLDTNIDLSQYKSVVIYCKSFSVSFGSAALN